MKLNIRQRLSECCLLKLPALLLGLLLFTNSQAQEIDEVVLIVDDIAVTAHEYSVLHFIQTQASSFQPFVPDLEGEATQAIIDDLLLAAHAKRLAPDVNISDTQINAAINTLARRNSTSGDQLLAGLQSQGVDTQIFKSAFGQRLMVQEVIGQGIARGITVTSAEIQEYIDNRPELSSRAQKSYRVSHLVVSVDDGLKKSQIRDLRKLAENLRGRLLAGESFNSVAAEYETVSASGDKGDLGWKKREELPELFVGALVDLEVGDVSKVLESSNGFHLLALTDIQSAGGAPQEYRVRHIAKALQPPANEQQLVAQLNNIKLQVLAGLDFAALAQTQSDDVSSAAKGGDLGWLQLDQIDPGFAQALQALEVGEISDPVRTQVGLHLIQLMQIRSIQGASNLETQIQQRIFSEKLDEQMQDLLNDIKQVALVEVVES